MAIELDFDGLDPEEIGDQQQMDFVAKPGRCHAMLTDVAEFGDTKSGRHIAKWEILAHEDPGEVAKVFWDYVNQPSKNHRDGGKAARNILFTNAIALGLATKSELVEMAKSGKSASLDFSQAVGRQAFLSLREDTYEGKTRIKFGGIFALTDERAKNFPRNEGMLKRAKNPQPASAATSDGEQQQPQQGNPFAGRV